MKTADFFRLQLADVLWAQESTSPNAGGGTAAPIGSFWQRASAYPSPDEMYLKLLSSNTGWMKQNLINIQIFNVQRFGAVGDGVTNDLTAIRAALAAAVAAGGGAVYFPATANFYSIVKVAGAGQTNLIDITGTNITFFGDGYASKVRQTGTCGGFETRMFTVRNGASRIKFFNFYLDAATVTNPDPAEQNHGIQLLGSSGVAGNGPNDVEIVGMYFGRFPGDGVRFLAESGKEVDSVKIARCAFDMANNNATGSRSAIGIQRFSKRIQIHWNWVTEAHDQQIDFEPTGVPDPDFGGPSEYSILGNLINHASQNTDCVTLSGAGQNEAARSRRNQYKYNLIDNGGALSGRNLADCEVCGNISLYNAGSTTSAMEFFENTSDCIFDSNIAQSLNTTQPRSAFRTSFQNGAGPKRLLISNNNFYAQGGAASVAVDVEDLTQSAFLGNMARLTASGASTSIGFNNHSVNQNISSFLVAGNMVFSDGVSNLLAGYRFTETAGKPHRNQSYRFNWVSGGATNGYRFDAITGDWRGAVQNIGVGVTGQLLSTVQAVGEGPIGPGSQIDVVTFAAGPDSNVTAPVGSLATNNSGGQNNTLFVKESGSGVSGSNTGWVHYGATEVAMGAAAGSVATTARFFAPGGADLAAETTVELQWTAPRAGTIRNLRLSCTAGTGGGVNTYTVRKNGVNTTVTISINNTASSGSDTTHSFTVAAGDLISLTVTKTLAPATPQTKIQATVELI